MKLKATRRSFYVYRCAGCGNERRSVIYGRAAEEKLCRKCKRGALPTNMNPLFDLDKFLAGAEKAGDILNEKAKHEKEIL